LHARKINQNTSTQAQQQRARN